MYISWHGHYTVKITSKHATIVIDPHDGSTVGGTPFRSKADIIALTNTDDLSMSSIRAFQENTIIIRTPGEFAVHEVSLSSIGWRAADNSERSIQRWIIEDVVILAVGALTRPLHDSELEMVERAPIDVLIVPIGGDGALDSVGAVQLVNAVEPHLVIPIHYAIGGSKKNNALQKVDEFAKAMRIAPRHFEEKYLVKKSLLNYEEVHTVLVHS